MECRHCEGKLDITFIDLGIMPLSNSYLNRANLNKVEKSYPLRVKVCETCWLVQTEKFVEAEQIFSRDYIYFSSFYSVKLIFSMILVIYLEICHFLILISLFSIFLTIF